MTVALPHRDHDAVMTLYAHYFLASELMFKNYKKLIAKRDKQGRLSRKSRVEQSIYFSSWLGFLAVTAEGFKRLKVRKLMKDDRPSDFVELIPEADKLGKFLKKHDDALRRFRNNVFHLRDNTEEIERFFREQPNRLEWAEELQTKFSEMFSNYRIICQTYYILEGRKEEII